MFTCSIRIIRLPWGTCVFGSVTRISSSVSVCSLADCRFASAASSIRCCRVDISPKDRALRSCIALSVILDWLPVRLSAWPLAWRALCFSRLAWIETLTFFKDFLALVVLEVSSIAVSTKCIQFDDLVHEVQQASVMADDNHAARPLANGLVELLSGGLIQMVGGFVQQ